MKRFYFLILCFSWVLPSSQDVQENKRQRRVTFNLTVQVYDEQGKTQEDTKQHDGKRIKEEDEELFFPFAHIKIDVDLSDSDSENEQSQAELLSCLSAERLKNSLNACSAIHKKDDKA